MSDAKRKESAAEDLRRVLRDHPHLIRDDEELLADLGLRVDAANIVDFGPAALARVHAAHRRESRARKQLEATARANFAAQAQTHAAVVDLLEARKDRLQVLILTCHPERYRGLGHALGWTRVGETES